MTRASRKFFSSFMWAGLILCAVLGSLVILGMVLSAATATELSLNPNSHIGCSTFAARLPPQLDVPCPQKSLNHYKIAQVLAAFGVSCLFFGFVFNVSGLAENESDAVRDSLMKYRGGAYNPNLGHAEVVTAPGKFWLGLIFTALGISCILAAVCTAIASSVSRDDWSFKIVTVVLSFTALVGSLLLLFLVLKRREDPIQQAELQYNNAAVQPQAAAAP